MKKRRDIRPAKKRPARCDIRGGPKLLPMNYLGAPLKFVNNFPVRPEIPYAAGQAQKLQAPAMFGGFAAAAGVKHFADGAKGWFIIDQHGQRMHGPFRSQNAAQTELDKRLNLPFAAGGAAPLSGVVRWHAWQDAKDIAAAGRQHAELNLVRAKEAGRPAAELRALRGVLTRKENEFYAVADRKGFKVVGWPGDPDYQKRPAGVPLGELPPGAGGNAQIYGNPYGASGFAQVHPATPPTGAMGSPVQDIPVGQIEGDPTQPRKDFDPVLLKELSDSMATVGQIHPILVRPHPDKPGAFMLVAGERRWRAAQKAGFKTISAEVRDLAPAQVADIQLAENEVRARPKESETAKFVADRIRKGDPLEKIAKALGKSAQWVRGRQSMAGLAAFLLDLMDSGKLAVGVAAALGELPQEVQRSVWEAAALHSKTASGQEAYVRAVALREAGQDLFGQKIIEHVSGLTPKQRKALITGVERSLKCAHRLAANKGGDVTAYASTQTNASETLEQVKELARALQRAARNVEKVRASRAVSRKHGRPDVMHKTQQHARKPGFWARIFG